MFRVSCFGMNVRLVLAAISSIVFVQSFLNLTSANAGLIFDNHSFVGVSGLYGAAGPVGFHNTTFGEGTNAISNYTSHFTGDTLVTAEALASASSNAETFLRTYAKGTGSSAGGFTPAGQAEAVAAWRDVAFVIGETTPQTLRLNFSLNGLLEAQTSSESPYATAYSQITLGLASGYNSSESLFNRLTQFGVPQYNYARFGDAFLSIGGDKRGHWDTLEYMGDGSFQGTFHIDVDFDQEAGGYVWGLGLSSYASGSGGVGVSDISHTLTFQSASLTNGSPVEVSFESGLSSQDVSAVPEPSSIILFGLGAIGLSFIAKRSGKSSQGLVVGNVVGNKAFSGEGSDEDHEGLGVAF